MTPRQKWIVDRVLAVMGDRGPSCIHEIAMAALETPPHRGYAKQAHYQQVRLVLLHLERDGAVTRRRFVGPGGSDFWERASDVLDMAAFEQALASEAES